MTELPLTPEQRAAVHALQPIQLPRGWASPPGCTCGGVTMHVTTCQLLELPPEAVLAAITESHAKLAAFSEACTAELRVIRTESP